MVDIEKGNRQLILDLARVYSDMNSRIGDMNSRIGELCIVE